MRTLRTILSLVAVLPAVSCLSLHKTDREQTGEKPPRLAIGRERSIPEPGSAGRRRPAAAYGGGVYLLAWSEGFSGHQGRSDILAVRVGPNGKALDAKPIPVCTDPGVQDLPAVAFCGDAFLVAWAARAAEGGANADFQIRYRRVGADAALGPVQTLPGDALRTWPALASDGTNTCLLAWQEYTGDHFAVRGTRLSMPAAKRLDDPALPLMTRTKELGTSWAGGVRMGLAWTGNGYVVCQGGYAAYLGPEGNILLPVTHTWPARFSGGHAAAAAWGQGFAFLNAGSAPDPWGWGGPGLVAGVAVTPQGTQPRYAPLLEKLPKRFLDPSVRHHGMKMDYALLADGHAVNTLDAAQWLNHPGWPMGMYGELRHTMGDLWPSGPPAAAFNGESLVVVWPRAHLADNRRLVNRDLYLTRLLPGWSKVDAFPVPVTLDPVEESNPMLCAGPTGQTLLAYEKLTPQGPTVRYRMLDEARDRTPPAVARVMPMSATELVVTFDEPIENDNLDAPGRFAIDGLAIQSVEFSPDARSGRRDVILTVSPREIGRKYTLHVRGITDRSPARNRTEHEAFVFLAKPGVMLRAKRLSHWDNFNSSELFYTNPDRIGIRDYICRWNLLTPLPRDPAKHPFDPQTVRPAPGDRVSAGAEWKAADGEAVDLGVRFGKQGARMIYAFTYIFSEQPRDAVLRLDSNNHNRAWLNGRRVNDGIGTAQERRRFHVYSDDVPVRLQAGWNRLLLQVDTHGGEWMMSARLNDPAGRPLRDVTYRLERPDGLL
jgi:hypothetical protein